MRPTVVVMDPELGASATQPLLPQPDGPASLPGVVLEGEHWSKAYARQAYAALTNLATSLFCGVVAGFGLKTIGQSVAIALVLLFIGIQILAYYGYVDFKWRMAARQVGGVVVGQLDVNKDGRVDLQDVTHAVQRFAYWALSWGVPSVLGFTLGFWFGWKVL
ncbi:hypothetical protein V8C86DRAFT_2633927 [Haematococcus lacustris]